MRAIHVVSVFAATALLALTGCAEEQAAPEATNSAATTAPSAAATDEPAEVTPAETPTTRPEDDGSAETAPLKLTTPSGTTTLALTDVHCSGQPGHLHHIIGKTNHQLPLVELTPDEFAMVKVGQGRPFKTTDPAGVTIDNDGVTVADAAIGGATLNGAMTCTTWED